MESLQNRTVLVTGSSSGIGLALVKRLWKSSYRVIATTRGRSLQVLHQQGFEENYRFWIRELDVTNPDQRRAVVAEADERWGGVDVLVNNAGVSYRAVTEHLSGSDQKSQFDVNYVGPMALVRLVLPSMRRKRQGRIINVSSVGGMMAMPTMGAYSASKFALEGASEALYYECIPWNIKVSLVRPGFVRSDSYRNTFVTEAAKEALKRDSAYAEYYHHMEGFIERLMNSTFATSDSVAKKILYTMERSHPPLRVSATFDAALFVWIRRLLPWSAYHWLLYRNLPGITSWGPADENKS